MAARRLVVRFENTGDEAVTIDRFERRGADPRDRDSCATEPFELPPGDAIAIRLDLPAAECGEEAGAAGAPRRRDDTASGPAEPASSLADDPFDTLARVAAADCLAESVDAVATIVDARAPAVDRRRASTGARHRRRGDARGLRFGLVRDRPGLRHDAAERRGRHRLAGRRRRSRPGTRRRRSSACRCARRGATPTRSPTTSAARSCRSRSATSDGRAGRLDVLVGRQAEGGALRVLRRALRAQ